MLETFLSAFAIMAGFSTVIFLFAKPEETAETDARTRAKRRTK